MKVGVLSFQGDVSEHLAILKSTGAQAAPVKHPDELATLDGLILPGGESTTLGLLLNQSGMDKAIQKKVKEGMPVWGTCMGAILLAKHLVDNVTKQSTLNLMNISVRRNAFGRQQESFEEDILFSSLPGGPFHCVFIRAPLIEEAGPHVQVLGTLNGKIIFAREKNLLASMFHPELAHDRRVHQYFLDMLRASLASLEAAAPIVAEAAVKVAHRG